MHSLAKPTVTGLTNTKRAAVSLIWNLLYTCCRRLDRHSSSFFLFFPFFFFFLFFFGGRCVVALPLNPSKKRQSLFLFPSQRQNTERYLTTDSGICVIRTRRRRRERQRGHVSPSRRPIHLCYPHDEIRRRPGVPVIRKVWVEELLAALTYVVTCVAEDHAVVRRQAWHWCWII